MGRLPRDAPAIKNRRAPKSALDTQSNTLYNTLVN